MQQARDARVAVLLATYNGTRFLEQQILSLARNNHPFTLHWLDDHSTDDSRSMVRTLAQQANIALRERHEQNHLGVPVAFFNLLEKTEADIYLFCDQDDVWEAGKIDAVVANLLPDLHSPVLCYTDPFIFRTNAPDQRYRLSEVMRVSPEVGVQESRLFMSVFANGHSQGFTRALRDIYLSHKDIARAYAYMHDEWMHVTAIACGQVRLLPSAPTTQYRWHGSNASGDYGGWKGKGRGRPTTTWKQQQSLRRALSRHAKGFLLAASTFPPSPKLDRLIEIARLMSDIDQRLSPLACLRLLRQGMISPSRPLALRFAAACLCSKAASANMGT